MNKVLIRPLRFEDAFISWKWRNDPKVWEHTGSKPNILVTEEIEKQWILEKLEERNSVRFAIEVDDVYVGNIQLTNIIEKKTAEYHIFIGDKSYWGKGVASLATAQIIRYAKNVINLQSLYLSVRPENNSAIRVYEKSGFVKINDDVKMTLDLSKVNAPLVSVFMMAYNHEKYISEAIEGVLMQNTNFDFDIVIGEDCSTDNTRQIILDYQRKYPGKFKLLLHKENIGAMANQQAVFSVCTGKYIAMCEGDDYWTDPYKLQKQVDFLESNHEFGLVHTQFKIFEQKSGVFSQGPQNRQHVDLFRLLGGNAISSLTVCFRRELIVSYLKEIRPNDKKWIMGDYPLWIYIAGNSKIGFIPEYTAVYRKLEESASNSKNSVYLKNFWNSSLDVVKYMSDYFKIDKDNENNFLLTNLRAQLSIAYRLSDSNLGIHVFKNIYKVSPKRIVFNDLYLLIGCVFKIAKLRKFVKLH